jgi:hypothetical protein
MGGIGKEGKQRMLVKDRGGREDRRRQWQAEEGRIKMPGESRKSSGRQERVEESRGGRDSWWKAGECKRRQRRPDRRPEGKGRKGGRAPFSVLCFIPISRKTSKLCADP